MSTCTERTECKILIVEDSQDNREIYRECLVSAQNLDCQIRECESAEEALEMCIKDCPDLILLDYILPKLDGLQFLRQAIDRLETMPAVIMVTGKGSETIAVEAMKHGVRDYVVKGRLTPEQLVNIVVNTLNDRQLKARIDAQLQQQEVVARIALKISQSLELSSILQAAVEGTRELLGCDRTLVCHLGSGLNGTIVAESVLSGWSVAECDRLESTDPVDPADRIEHYLQGHKTAISDIESADLTDYDLHRYRQFQAKAVLTVPILVRDTSTSPLSESRLWGLLIAHHCQTVHHWNTDELDLLDRLSLQMSIAIQQAELVADLKATLATQQAIEHQLRERVLEIEQANLQLSATSHLLADRNQELNDFSHIVSHDLQAPLRGISNLAQWLGEDLGGKLPAKNQQQLDLIKDRVVQMTALIDGLLRYARIGRETIDSLPTNIGQLLAEVVDILAPPPNFQVLFAADLPTIETQALLLKQVFTNLIGNAIKYHDRPNGRVEVLVTDLGSVWQFTIVDDGPGIDPEHHHKIFGMFKRLVSGDNTKGTGIGLAIVQKIVEAQGGSVWVESKLGKGSAFSFTWPKLA